jgi:hypothetical protein
VLDIVVDNDVDMLHVMSEAMVGVVVAVAARSPRHMTPGLSRLRR